MSKTIVAIAGYGNIGKYTLQDCMEINEFPQWLEQQTLENNE